MLSTLSLQVAVQVEQVAVQAVLVAFAKPAQLYLLLPIR
jgi:hypothetical protein